MATKIYLIFLLSLTACAGLPTFPKLRPRLVDSQQTAVQCETDDSGRLHCDEMSFMPIEKVFGYICLSPTDITATRRWVKKVDTEYTCKLK